MEFLSSNVDKTSPDRMSESCKSKPWVPDIERARELVSQGESKRKVAKYLGIAESTLRKRLKNLPRQPTTLASFTPEMEEELVKYCSSFNDMSGGLTFTALRKIAYNFVEENHIENTFDKSVRMTDAEFIYEFLQRHPSIQKTLRQAAPSDELGREQLGYFFDALKEQLLAHQFNAARIYNVALLDVSLARPDKTTDNISAICAASASAHYVPPAFVFHGHAFSLELLAGAPPCSIAIPHNLDILLEWLRHFQKHVHSSHQDPVLLVLNEHTFSTSKCVVEFAKFHGIVLLGLPSHRLQPLGRTVLGAFRVLYGLECDNWCKLHRAMTYKHVAAVFRRAYFRAATMENAVEGFRMSGICPYDRDVVLETAGAPPSSAGAGSTASSAASAGAGDAPMCHTIFQNVVCEYEDLDAPKPAAGGYNGDANGVCDTALTSAIAGNMAASVDGGASGFTDLGCGQGPEIESR